VLSVARVYERRTTSGERGGYVGASLALGGAAELLRRAAWRLARRALRGRMTAGILVPVLGAAVGGALSYACAITMGGLAREFYRERRPRSLLPRVSRAR
jgi:hypothetical protein